MARLGRTRRTRRAVLTAIAVVTVTTLAVGSAAQAAAPTQSNGAKKVLGPKDPAKGTPVRIGFVTDDVTASTDNSIETPVAEAATKWLNAHRGGIGGRPIELVRCVSGGDPGKSADCANQMIRDDVAAVVTGSQQFMVNLWNPLHAAGIPLFVFGTGSPDLLADADSTFVLGAGQAALVNLMVGAAKANKAKKVTVVAIDVPAATQYYKEEGPARFAAEKLQMDLVPVALGTADMTPQMQRVVSDNPDGVVFVIGNDTFCIAAFNGLRAAGFDGALTTIPQCLSDATRTAVPGDFLEGVQISANAPVDTPKHPAAKLYNTVLDRFGASGVDKTRVTGYGIFQALAGLAAATQDLSGEVTPASIIAAAKSMPWSELPTSGIHVRCNGKANAAQPAVCATGTLAATLNAAGKATKYRAVGDDPIPD